jgi:NAD(P)-dependent dehydrogenase (short-subunit alcohol dehydrogenase family)
VVLERFSLEGKTAVVTGGGTNLGRAMSCALARAGADIVVAARTKEPLFETVKEVEAIGRRAIAVQTDVTNSSQVEHLIKTAIAEFRAVDILVNNAGVAKGIEPSPRDPVPKEPPPIWEFTDDMWHQAIDVNLTGAFYCSRAVARHMVDRKTGKIINIASVAGLRAARSLYTYCSSKGGVIMLSKTLAVTLARYGINVNAIAPGFFATAENDASFVAAQGRFIPLGRAGDPKEIGPLAVYLASDASSYVTGECFIIDGARCMGFGPAGYKAKASLDRQTVGSGGGLLP